MDSDTNVNLCNNITTFNHNIYTTKSWFITQIIIFVLFVRFIFDIESLTILLKNDRFETRDGVFVTATN